VENLVGRRGDLDNSVDPWPHPFKTTGAFVVGKQWMGVASFSGLRRREVLRLLLSELVQGLMVW
jgi:hypothetical protein